jgi:hypothetical protein
LLGKGFRVWPASWKDPVVAAMLIDASTQLKDPRMMGHLSTTWYQVKPDALADFVGTQAMLRRYGKLGRE